MPKKKRIIQFIFKRLYQFLILITCAIIIRVLLFEFYYIPSASMAGTLYEGDEIIVSKSSYGAVLPKRPDEIPIISMVVQIPVIGHFLKNIDWGLHKLPGWSKPTNGDIIILLSKNEQNLLVKRCVGIPGDTLQIINDTLYINNNQKILTPNIKLRYRLSNTDTILTNSLPQKYASNDSRDTLISLTTLDLQTLSKRFPLSKIDHFPDTSINKEAFYPHCTELDWNLSNYGPLIIPKKGTTITLDSSTLSFYPDIIPTNMHNLKEYTFKTDYYFVLGDNRYASYDSRFIGLIPEKHIYGKALYVLFSLENAQQGHKNLNWTRILKKIE